VQSTQKQQAGGCCRGSVGPTLDICARTLLRLMTKADPPESFELFASPIHRSKPTQSLLACVLPCTVGAGSE
jgi:hypothetical protein